MQQQDVPKERTRKNILIIPFPGISHIIPHLEFAKKLAAYHSVTFAVSETVLTENKYKETFSTEPGTDITFFGIKDGYIHGKHDMFNDFIEILQKSNQGAAHTIDHIPTVDAVITDTFLAGSAMNSHAKQIPHYIFDTSCADILPLFLELTDDTPVIPDEQDPNGFFRYRPLFDSHAEKPKGVSQEYKTVMLPYAKVAHLTAGVIINSMREFEKDAVKRMEADPTGRTLPMYFVGPLLSSENTSPNSKQFEETSKIKAWLNSKPNKSVVYFSLGTVGRPSKKEVEEISKGLLSLDKPFIMSLKPDVQEFLIPEIKDKITEQFKSTSTPFLVLPWVTQKMVLSHPACAVFVSHCGWNSTLETLAYGVSVVAWPLFGDQELDAKKLEKEGVAKVLEGTGVEPTREITAAELADAVREVGGFDLEDGSLSTYSTAARLWKARLQDEQTKNGDMNDLLETFDTMIK